MQITYIKILLVEWFERGQADDKRGIQGEIIQSGLLTWDEAGDIDFDYMYNDLHFIDSTVAVIFEIGILLCGGLLLAILCGST